MSVLTTYRYTSEGALLDHPLVNSVNDVIGTVKVSTWNIMGTVTGAVSRTWLTLTDSTAEPGVDFDWFVVRQPTLPQEIIYLTVYNDMVVEGDEYVTFSSFQEVGGEVIDVQLKFIIRDNTPQVSIPEVSLSLVGDAVILESTQDKTFQVMLNEPSNEDIALRLSYYGDAAVGQDFTDTATVTIPAGATRAEFSVALLEDITSEGIEDLTVAIDSVIAGNALISAGVREATVTIVDDEIMHAIRSHYTDSEFLSPEAVEYIDKAMAFSFNQVSDYGQITIAQRMEMVQTTLQGWRGLDGADPSLDLRDAEYWAWAFSEELDGNPTTLSAIYTYIGVKGAAQGVINALENAPIAGRLLEKFLTKMLESTPGVPLSKFGGFEAAFEGYADALRFVREDYSGDTPTYTPEGISEAQILTELQDGFIF